VRLEALLERLDGVRQLNDDEWMAICPTHEDAKPSLAITRSDKRPGDGVVHCFAGCKATDILQAIQGGVRVNQSNGHSKTHKLSIKLNRRVASRDDDRSALEWLRDYTGLGEAFLKKQDIDFKHRGSIGYRFGGMDTVKWRDYGKAGGKGRWESNGEASPPLWPTLPDKVSDVVFLGTGETDTLCLRAALDGTGVDAFSLTKGEGYVPQGALKELRKRGCVELVYVPDLDAAGQRGAGKLQTAAERIGLKWTSISLEEHLDGALGEKDVRDLTRRIGIEALLEILQQSYEQGPPELAVSAIEFAAQAPESIRWLVKPLLAVGITSLISGMAKTGKTTFLFKLMHEMEKGGRVLDFEVTQCKVLVWTENSAIVWREKCKALFAGNFPGHVYVISRDNEALLGKTLEDNARAVFAEAKRKACKLVVLDSLAGITGVEDENDAAKVSAVLVSLNRLARRYDVSLGLIHHLNKAGTSPRGSGVFMAEPDVLIEMQGEYKEPRTLKIKTNLLMDAPDPVVFTMDEDGEYHIAEVKQGFSEILSVLSNRVEEALTLRELADQMELEPLPVNLEQLRRALKQLMRDGAVRATEGGGKGRGNAAKYYKVTLKVKVIRGGKSE
jgi:AAA domain